MPKRDGDRKTKQSVHLMPDHILKRRATAGDDNAWLVLVQRQMLQQMCTDPEHRRPSMEIPLDDDRALYFRECDGVIKVYVELHPRISLDWTKAHWAEMMGWRDRLYALQGPWLAGGKELLGLELHTRHSSGESYQDLADNLNARIAQALISWEDEQARARTLISRLGERSYAVEFDGYGGAAVYLHAVGFADDEITIWCESAKENMAGNKPLFPPGEPISRDQLIAWLRAWRARHREWLIQGLPQNDQADESS